MRKSTRNPTDHVLSVVCQGKLLHFIIVVRQARHRALSLDSSPHRLSANILFRFFQNQGGSYRIDDGPLFPSLWDLVR